MNPLLLDLPEAIETPRLILQMPRAGFGKKLHEALMDGYGDCVKWLQWPITSPTVEAVEIDCRKHHAQFVTREFIRYIIFEKATQTIVGRCAFPSAQANWLVPQLGISYFIRQSQRGKGYATESAHALTLLAFRALQARKVEIYCDAENVASMGTPLKLNFELEYTQRGGWVSPNGELPFLKTYSLFDPQKLPDLSVTW